MDKMLIVGGSGFIGRHLIRRRAAEGGHRIVSVDICEPSERLEGVEYVIHDVRNLSSLQGHDDVSIIYNLAAIHTTPGHDDWEYYDTNVRGALETVKWARHRGILQILFTSSISVYGPSEEQKDESSPTAPNSAYGWSKILAEEVFRDWVGEDDNRKLLIVRPAVVFGEGEGGNFTRLAKLLQSGYFIYPGRKNTIKASIYVKDLLDYLDVMWARTGSFAIFNGCYAERYTLEQVVGSFRAFIPKVREVSIPAGLMVTGASALKLLPHQLGIHPERILKLIRSTNIYPSVLVSEGLSKADPLSLALKDWHDTTRGNFR